MRSSILFTDELRVGAAANVATMPADFGEQIISALHRVQGKDPLSPVTLLCSPAAVDDVTRAAASQGPVANVVVQTVAAFVADAARVLGRRPLQREDVAAEVADLLRDDAPRETVFHRKHLHSSPATLEGLTDAVFTLANFPASWRSEHDDLALPTAVAEMTDEVLRRVGKEVYTYPEAVEAAREVASERNLIVVGEVAFDSVTQWTLEQFGCAEWVKFAGAPEVLERVTFVAEADEAKYVAAKVAQAVEQRTPLHRLSVAYCDEVQLPALVRAFEQAGIPFTAPSIDVWAQNPYFRAIVTLLRIDPAQTNRRDLAGLLQTGAVEEDTRPSLARFDAVTRDKDQQYYAGTDWDAPSRAENEGKKTSAESVRGWVLELRRDLEAVWNAESWGEVAQCLRGLVDKRLRAPWGAEVIYRDGVLDHLAAQRGAVSRERAIDAVGALFDRPQVAAHRGLVTLGPLSSLDGRDLDTAFIVGAVDAALPGSVTASATITPGQSNTAAADFLRYRDNAFDATLRSARKVVLSNPRSHQDGSGKTQPSQWVSESGLRSRLGDADLKVPVVDYGQAAQLLADGTISPISAQDLALLRAAQGSGDGSRYAEVMAYRNSGARESDVGAEFNGYTGSDLGRELLAGEVSNSALERFTVSPQFFFIERVLHAYPLADNVDPLGIEATEGGSLYHSIFEDWTVQVLIPAHKAAEPIDKADWWTAVARPRFDEIVERHLSEFSTARVNEAAMKSFQSTARKRLDAWFEAEQRDVLKGWRPIAAELGFGKDAAEDDAPDAPFIVLPSGERMHFRGLIDRVDYKPGDDGTAIRITDYKSGSGLSKAKKSLSESPIGGPENGFKFQLALYGYALYQRFVQRDLPAEIARDVGAWFPEVSNALAGEPEVTSVTSRYWYFQESGEGKDGKEKGEVSIEITEPTIELLRHVLGEIYRYVASGVFPPSAKLGDWVDDAELRIGVTQYQAVTDALGLAGHGHLPLLPMNDATATDTATDAEATR